MHTLDRSRPTIGAQAVGIAQGALDYAVGYMKERRTFGHPLAENQGLQWMVADAAMRIEAARGLVYRACALVDEGDPDGQLSVAGAMAWGFIPGFLKAFTGAHEVVTTIMAGCVEPAR